MARGLYACLEKATPNPNLDLDEFWDEPGPLGYDHLFSDRDQRMIGPIWDPDPATNLAAKQLIGPIWDPAANSAPQFGMHTWAGLSKSVPSLVQVHRGTGV